jgi:hypothetical protein
MKRQKRNKFIKIMILIICLVFMCKAISSMIASTNTGHLICCHIDNCQICMLIHSAMNFGKNLSYIIEYIILLNVIVPLCCILQYFILEKPHTLLVKLKVRLDE